MRPLARCGAALSLSLTLLAAAGAAPTHSPPSAKAHDGDNGAVHFTVTHFEVTGNTLLPEKVVNEIFAKRAGTNVTFDDVAGAEKELQLEYHNRGFDTVHVVVPPQRLTNGVFKLRVFEGKLVEIVVTGNRFFSDKNVRRALPGLRTNAFLNSKFFQPQLDMANLNQDRQIYPELMPGPVSNTTTLVLHVKDQLPLHAKVEANNESTPGTPEMRVAASAAYNNLWQLEHSIGVQYTFSEQNYKQAPGWDWYNRPLVANYSAFYRVPLSSVNSIADQAANSAGKFGYNEATRQFVLPPSAGATELNVYGSGSTIDTGLLETTPKTLFSGTNGTISQTTSHQDLTYNNALGWRLTQPILSYYGIHSHLQVGTDYKTYRQNNFETNDFIFVQYLVSTTGQPFTRVSTTPSPVPPNQHYIAYLPLTLHADADRDDPMGNTGFAVNYSPNLWHSGSRTNVEAIAGSPKSSGFWQVITGDITRDQALYRGWRLSLKADGQWADEPLIANEQFGAGGIAGVRGYHEGEIYGDTGWRLTSELKAPPYRVGFAGRGTSRPLIVRGSIFLDYADTYLLDPEGRKADSPLWGAGFAGAASLGSHFNGMLSFGWPLQSTPTTEAYQVRIAFLLSAQF